MARIASSTHIRRDHEEWIYKLEPTQELPLLDLSISVKSRFLSAKGLERFDRFVTHRQLLFYGISIAMLLYPASLLVDKSVGKWLAVVTSLIGLPAAIVGSSLLRYNVVTLLLTTYDVWYFSIMNTATLLVLAMCLGDVRSVSMFVAWVGFQPMVLIDSNLRAIRKLTLISVMGIVGMAFFMVLVASNRIEGIYEFVLFRYKSNLLYAKSFVNNGLLTLMLLLARNMFRNRGHFCAKRSVNAAAVMECVSYRCRLKLCETRSLRASAVSSAVISSEFLQQQLNRPVYMQKMRYVPRIHNIDPRNTIILFPFTSSLSSGRWVRMLFILVSFCSSVTSVIAIGFDIHRKDQNVSPRSGIFPSARLLALILTTVHCGVSFELYQRKLLVEILRSFDFAFFSAHITILHLCMADFFHWREDCAALLITWLWFHWALCLDALTPIVRLKIGFHVRHVAPVFLISIVAPACTTVYLMATSPTSSSAINDRVLFEWEILNTLVRVRVLPIFYNCVPTAFALSLRFAWRLCTYANDDLLFIDGEVVYNNYFRRARNPESRRRSGSVSCVPTTAMFPGDSVGSELSMTESKW